MGLNIFKINHIKQKLKKKKEIKYIFLKILQSNYKVPFYVKKHSIFLIKK